MYGANFIAKFGGKVVFYGWVPRNPPLGTNGSKSTLALSVRLDSYSNASVFLSLCRMCISFFEVKSVLPIDQYQNATPRAISLHELKKVKLQERFTLVPQDPIGHLKTLCMSVLSLAVAFESE